RGQPLQLQGNVRGLDGRRNDVVTVSGNVLLRPDLAVGSLSAPATARPGSFVNVAATIRELNGDAGAKANCKLFVDGAQFDEARDVFVDVGSAVSCLFTLRFDTAGTHTLRIDVDGVVPADWDSSNNSAETTLAVTDPNSAPFNWIA